MLTVNTNTTALIAQNNLGGIQKALENSMGKLSTGKRINSAGDDAAGMQVANRMTTQIRGLDVAMRNANDAISMTQTAEGALQEHSNIMNRMRDLALQSANDTNSLSERKAMQQEITQLQTELDRIAETTDFSGKKLLDGSAQDMTFQIGANANETISFSISKMDSESLKGEAELTMDKSKVADALTKLNGIADNDGSVGTAGEAIEVKIGDKTLNISPAGTADKIGKLDAKELAKQINTAISNEANIPEMKVSAAATGELIFVGADNTEIDFNSNSATTARNTVASIDIESAAGAQQAIRTLDGALSQVGGERAGLGAIQNRLDATLSNMSNVQENMIASRSRIEDVDFAKEATTMTRNQMLMQAGASVLMQAKGLPQFALQLL